MTVKQSLYPWLYQPGVPKPRMADIAAIVAEQHGLTVEQLRSRLQSRKVAWARQEAMALIRATGFFSFSQIGRWFGRDHTTVIYAVAECKRRGTIRLKYHAQDVESACDRPALGRIILGVENEPPELGGDALHCGGGAPDRRGPGEVVGNAGPKLATDALFVPVLYVRGERLNDVKGKLTDTNGERMRVLPSRVDRGGW